MLTPHVRETGYNIALPRRSNRLRDLLRIETTSEAGKNFADLSFEIDRRLMETLLEGVVL